MHNRLQQKGMIMHENAMCKMCSAATYIPGCSISVLLFSELVKLLLFGYSLLLEALPLLLCHLPLSCCGGSRLHTAFCQMLAVGLRLLSGS